jgi:methionyl-tRNA synthetase
MKMNYLVTSATPYINGTKHLGNLVGSLLPADVYARFLRQQRHEVLFICATDDHGTPAELAALADGTAVAEYCDRQHDIQKAIYEEFGLSFDYFGRSSSEDNHKLTQHFYQKLDENGFIEEKEITQIYSLEDRRFLPDRYVEGTCPRCKYEFARGDQCENCTSVLNPTDLLNPRSAISGSTNLERRKTKHLFLKLSKLAPEIRSWVESHQEWPKLTSSIALKWLNEGLKDRCITRDLDWGVPVPRKGFEGKVFYVWFDAPIAYVSTTQTWAAQNPTERDWKKWWHNGDKVQYTQFMAKDNIPFHTVFWPAVILGTREKWKLADYIKGFNWLTYYGGKFSTSQKHGVFTDQALKVLPADYWRYALISNAPESQDSAFTWELLQSKVNDELADKLGNFINRTLKFAQTHYGSAVPPVAEFSDNEKQLEQKCKELTEKIATHFENKEFRKASDTLRALWDLGNAYFDENAPWKLVKTEPERAATVIATCINLINLYAVTSLPVIPFTSTKILDALGLNTSATFEEATNLRTLKAGHELNDLPPLFKKLEDSEVLKYKQQFGAEE